MSESSIETLGHSVGGGTYRHYAHRDPPGFKASMSLPQPTAFASGRLINVVHNADGLAVFDPADRPELRNIEALRHDSLDALRVVDLIAPEIVNCIVKSANATRISGVASHKGGTLPGVTIVHPSPSQLPVLGIERRYCSL